MSVVTVDIAQQVVGSVAGQDSHPAHREVVVPSYIPTIEETIKASGAHCQGTCASVVADSNCF